jgi:diguanylate cyclase (GGDEF)-like protein
VILDLRTVFVVTSMACVILGGLQLTAQLIHRFGRWSAFWGLSNVFLGLGVLGVSLRHVLPDFVSIQLSNVLAAAGYALLPMSVRAFAGRPSRWWAWGLATIAATEMVMFLWRGPDGYPVRAVFMLSLLACCDGVVIFDGMRLARSERLTSAWVLVGLFSLTAPIFAMRALLALTGVFAGKTPFPAHPGAFQWLVVSSVMFVPLRGITLLLMAAERSHNLLLALSQQDHLTGVMNRIGLQFAFDQLARPRDGELDTLVSVLAIDLDHFKNINDRQGHAAGDEILRLFTIFARSKLRSTDILARQGGDEFVVVLPRTAIEEAVEIAERIRDAFAGASTAASGSGVRPTLSIGAAEGDIVADGLHAILTRADEALYRSKRQGRNRVSTMAHPAEAPARPAA